MGISNSLATSVIHVLIINSYHHHGLCTLPCLTRRGKDDLIACHKDQFMTNSQMHKITTWQTFDLYIPAANLMIYQKGVYYQGIKICNHLPKTIKDLSGDKNKFKLALKRYLLHNSFCSLKEYFDT